MPDSAAPRRSPREIAAGPAGLIALFVAVPLVLGAIWLLRGAPPVPSCGEGLGAAEEAMRQAWLAGARSAFGAGALIVLAGILRTSSLRRADRRPGAATIAVGALLALYVVVCMAVREAFAAYAILLVLAAVLWWASIPLVVVPAAVWFVLRPRAARPLAALAVLGWCSLLLGVGGVATFVALRATGPLLC
jgi:hypothetical protein